VVRVRSGVAECPDEGTAMDATSRPTGNLLLDALTSGEREGLLEAAAKRPLEPGHEWRRAGDPITSVAFPTLGTMSLIGESGGSKVEAATIGREGAADVFAAIASETAPMLLIAQVPGHAYEVEHQRFLKVYEDGPTIRRLIAGYIEALVVSISLGAVCLASHHLNERCARWLLETHDRVDEDVFELKQEFLATMLGAHRPSVSIAAKTLQTSGLIDYRRGKIAILDREGLEEAACPCYENIRTAYSRLVPLR
jgi:CRP-like cAMP-binding protein